MTYFKLNIILFLSFATSLTSAQLNVLTLNCTQTPEACVLVPDDCLISKTICMAGALVTPLEDNAYKFQIAVSAGNNYVALGFSSDRNMGNEVVVDCINSGTAPIVVPAVNRGFANTIQDENPAIQVVEAVNDDDGLYCTFIIQDGFSEDTLSVSFNETSYLLLAMGNVNADGKLAYHGQNKKASDQTFFGTNATLW